MTGKEKCYEMKKLREQIAQQYGIEGFEFKECDYDGDCDGYCPACDAEAQELRDKIRNIEKIDISKRPPNVLRGKMIEPKPKIKNDDIEMGKITIRQEDDLPPDAVGGLTNFEENKKKQIQLMGDVSFEYKEYYEDKKTKKKLRGIFKKKDKK